MPLLRRQFLTALAATPALPMTPAHASDAPADLPHVPWSRHAVLYQVNLRQFSAEGTFKAAQAELPRLKALGVDILWLMPIQPIGAKGRKGTLGSYYSIRDYTAVNPEFGTLADARAYVQAAQALGLKVILDWVANHTAFDHPWTHEHKDWYKLDAQGEPFPMTYNAGQPNEEQWTDVAQLNYERPALRDAMIAAMRFWVRELDLDGFRCDVASLVPTPFWDRARRELDAVKPMFMLAESDAKDLHRSAFDMTYSWDLCTLMQDIGKGRAGAAQLREWARAEPHGYPASAYRMRFTQNHDINSWTGTDAELYGANHPALAVLTFTLPGMPLIYNGQESGLDKRLEFFEKDPIAWKTHELQAFYAGLVKLKHAHPCLGAGQYGGTLAVLDVGNEALFAFRRQLEGDSVTVVVNVTATAQKLALDGSERSLPAHGWLAEPA